MCASTRASSTADQGVDVSTLESFGHDDVERVVRAVFGSCVCRSQPRRVPMEDMVRVDDRSMGLLRASSLWKSSLPHIERVMEKERLLSADKCDFVARASRQRPSVVYAVRYWEGLADTSSLATVLENIRQAWITCTLPNSQKSPRRDAAGHIHAGDNSRRRGSAVDANEVDRKLLGAAESRASISAGRKEGSTMSANSVSAGHAQGVQEEERSLATQQTGTTADPNDDAARKVRSEGFETENVTPRDAVPQIVSSFPEDTPVPGRPPSKRSSPVGVLGFAVELDSSQRKARAALIAEWPGVGSLQDLISGNIQVVGGASQEDLLRWTRQIAEGLVHESCSGSGSVGEEIAPRVSSRTAYLFPRPMDELQQGVSMLDARLATFLGGCTIPGTGERSDTPVAHRSLQPPELLSCKPDVVLKSLPTTSADGPRKRRIGTQAADVWGIGTLVFELATGRLAGPVPLAFRQLRDLVREVPIDPRFIYGDVARGVMRIALQRQPGDRARASDVAAAVEQITARTLRRAHTASDRQSLARRARRRERVGASAGGEQGTDESEGDASDGYGKALAQWRIDEAVGRAEGRAKVFLRRLWFNSLTEEDKRRIRHRRRHRKANREAREWRARRVRAAKMHHWTPAQVAGWITHLLCKAESSRKLPLLFSGDAKGGIASMGAEGTEGNSVASCVIAPGGKVTEEEQAGISSSKGGEELREVSATATAKTEIRASSSPVSVSAAPAPAPAPAPSPAPAAAAALLTVDPPNRRNGTGFPSGESTAAENVGLAAEGGQGRRDTDTDTNDDFDGKDREEGDDADADDTYDDQNSSIEGDNANGDDDNGWAEVEAGERTGYAGASVEPFAVEEGIDGACVIEAMDDALGHAEDALTRFVKSSTRLARPAEVEKKRVELMVRELLTVRPYSTPRQLKIRALCVVIVRSAEAPRDLTENQIDAQLPSLARVLTAGYRRQVAMVEQGIEFAAARIQGLARGKHIRRIFASIWRQAEEYARDIVRGERDTRLKKEKEQRAREKEEALEREREEAKRYRLRLVPRVSSVTCRGMIVSLPPFLVAAARGARRFLVVETTVASPTPVPLTAPPERQPSPLAQCTRASPTKREGPTAAAVDANSLEGTDNVVLSGDMNNVSNQPKRSGPKPSCGVGEGRIHVLLRQGAAAELKEHLDNGPRTPPTSPATATTSRPGRSGAASTSSGESREDPVKGTRIFLRAVGNGVSLSSLCPCTTYRLTLEVPPIIRDELLESARSLGLTEAIRSLATPSESDTNVGNGDDGVGGGLTASPVGYLDTETLPDRPSEVPFLTCKVLTSASAVDPRDPSGVLSLRQWQSPYPGVAEMDSPLSEDYVILAPGRPEPLVSLQWQTPQSNGLDICSYVVERRVGETGAWKKICAREVERNCRTAANGSSPERCDGGTPGVEGRRRSTDAVDAPLRTVSIDALKKVAVQGLSFAYRVYAENALGAGSSSKPVKVDLGAFLGHLRAQQGGRRAATTSRGQRQEPLLDTMPPARVADIPSPTVTNNNESLSSRPHGISLGSNPEAQQAVDCGEPVDDGKTHDIAPGNGAEGAKTWQSRHHQTKGKRAPLAPDDVPAPRAAAAFGDDFMGLATFGEPRVHSLFAPPSPSPRQRDQRTRLRAPAVGAHPHLCDVGGHRSGSGSRGRGPYPLPPIVLASGISGESSHIMRAELQGSHGGRQGGDGGGLNEDARRVGVSVARWEGCSSDLECRTSRRWNGSANTNEVFHAFINLGKRLPRRLPRDREQSKRDPI